jgi:hypothetical protein
MCTRGLTLGGITKERRAGPAGFNLGQRMKCDACVALALAVRIVGRNTGNFDV